MTTGREQEGLLSSWKEVAAYLNCSIRTCVRWEQNFGLPVHRFDNKSKSAIYAYKHELNAWLEKKLNSNNHLHGEGRFWPWLRKAAYVVLPVLGALAVYTLIFGLPGKKKVKVETVTPQSSGPLTLEANDIVTTEFSAAGRLRVWRRAKVNSYAEVWRIEPVRHSSFAIGDVDNDGTAEIAAPGYCRRFVELGGRRLIACQYFFNIYKPGVKDWWKTTYFNEADTIFDGEFPEIAETAIGNVDGVGGNELVLIARNSLGVFKYLEEKGEVKLLRSTKDLVPGASLFLRSMVVADVDGEGAEEIIVAADEWENGQVIDNRGKVLILKFEQNELRLFGQIDVDANFPFQSLRCGDVISGGNLEFVSPVYRKAGDAWLTFIMGWDSSGNMAFNKPISRLGGYQYQAIHLDVGKLIPEPGDQIVVGNQATNQLTLYYWQGNELVEGPHFHLHPALAAVKVYLPRVVERGEFCKEVVACGEDLDPATPGKLHLEIVEFEKGEMFTKWARRGGEKGDLPITYAAVVTSPAARSDLSKLNRLP